VLEIVGILLARFSLIPYAIAGALSAAIIYWRNGLLLLSRRRKDPPANE